VKPRALATVVEPEPRSLAERAYHAIVHMITQLELVPGSLIVEKELTEDLEIGRTPVREALQRLAMEGLVVHQLNRGMFVADITASGVQQIYEFRSLIDGQVVRLAAQRASRTQVDELEEVHEALVKAIDDDDADAYVALDRCFYRVLADCAQNVYLAEVIPRIFNQHLRLWFFISSRRGEWRDVARSHSEMIGDVVRAVRNRNSDEAELAIKSYISGRHKDMRDLL